MVGRPRRWVVPLTGSPEPERVLSSVCALAGEDDRVVGVVVIEISPLLPLDAEMNDEEASARVLLARARAVADAHGVWFVPKIVRSRDAASAVVELAEEEGAELVVSGSGSHGRRLRRPIRQLLRKASGPVLVV